MGGKVRLKVLDKTTMAHGQIKRSWGLNSRTSPVRDAEQNKREAKELYVRIMNVERVQ